MKSFLSWLRSPNEPEIELSQEQQSRFENPTWRASNSKWNYIIWLSLGMYAGLVLLVQGARAGSKSTVKLGLVHLALFIPLLPLATSMSESMDFLMSVFLALSLLVCGSGIIFTFWSNPKILRWKASRLQIFTTRSIRETEGYLETTTELGDLRADGPTSGPRKLDI